MKKFKVFALIFAIMLSATGLGILFGANQPASTQAKVSAEETTTLEPGIYKVGTDGKPVGKPTKSWDVIATKASNNSLNVNLSRSDGTYLVCGKLPEGVTSLYNAFGYSKSWLTDIIFTDSFDTSEVTDMSWMFISMGYNLLTNITFGSRFITSNVTNMESMFYFLDKLENLDLSGFDMSNVVNMDAMLVNSTPKTIKTPNKAKEGITLNDVSLAGNIYRVNSNGDLLQKTAKLPLGVTLVGGEHLLQMSLTNYKDATSIKFKKYSEVKNDIANWKSEDVSLCNDDTVMLYKQSNDSTDYIITCPNSDSAVYVCNDSPLFDGFEYIKSFDFSNLDTSKLTNMSAMFHKCSSLVSLDLSKFNTSNVTDMSGLFEDCSSLASLDLSNFNTNNVEKVIMAHMVEGCKSLQNIKMPNKMNAESDITLSALSLPSDKSWYSLASGAKNGTPVVADNKVSSYARNILTINPDKSYDAINAEVFTPAKPETPSTGVVLDVVLPAFSIVLVLASLVAVAFVGKKKKQ